jgi:hypothetical protein
LRIAGRRQAVRPTRSAWARATLPLGPESLERFDLPLCRFISVGC